MAATVVMYGEGEVGKEPFERRQTDMHSIHRQRRGGEEGPSPLLPFPVWVYRQPDAISGGETLD